MKGRDLQMTVVALEINSENVRFAVINTILAKDCIFSDEELIKELDQTICYHGLSDVVDACLQDLIDNGLIYEIGSKYKVRKLEVQ